MRGKRKLPFECLLRLGQTKLVAQNCIKCSWVCMMNPGDADSVSSVCVCVCVCVGEQYFPRNGIRRLNAKYVSHKTSLREKELDRGPIDGQLSVNCADIKRMSGQQKQRAGMIYGRGNVFFCVSN